MPALDVVSSASSITDSDEAVFSSLLYLSPKKFIKIKHVAKLPIRAETIITNRRRYISAKKASLIFRLFFVFFIGFSLSVDRTAYIIYLHQITIFFAIRRPCRYSWTAIVMSSISLATTAKSSAKMKQNIVIPPVQY